VNINYKTLPVEILGISGEDGRTAETPVVKLRCRF
jgi:hypothetical protein